MKGYFNDLNKSVQKIVVNKLNTIFGYGNLEGTPLHLALCKLNPVIGFNDTQTDAYILINDMHVFLLQLAFWLIQKESKGNFMESSMLTNGSIELQFSSNTTPENDIFLEKGLFLKKRPFITSLFRDINIFMR